MHILEELGLSEREAQVYEALLPLGECPIADVLHVIKLHPQLIYRAIDGLASKGLVLISFRRRRKYVKAEDPRILEKLETERLAKLRSILPSLIDKQGAPADAVVRVEKGSEAVRKARAKIIDDLPEKSTFSIIGASGEKFFDTMGEQLREIERKRLKKEIQRNVLAFERQRQYFNSKDKFKDKLTTYRFIPSDQETPSTTMITDRSIIIYVWNQDPITITIESRETARAYQSYFDTLWQIAKK